MTNIYDGKGGSIVYSEAGRRPTKDGKTWEAPASIIVSYRGNKQYMSVENLKFILMMLKDNPDLENKIGY